VNVGASMADERGVRGYTALGPGVMK